MILINGGHAFMDLLKKQNKLMSAKGCKKLVLGIILALIIFGLSYLFLFPLFYLISTAFQSAESLLDPSVVWLPRSFSLDNIKETFSIMDFGNSAFLTARITVLSTLASLISCSLVGYGMARYKVPEGKFVFALVILTIILPPQATLISSYLNFRFFDFGGVLGILEPITRFSSINLLNTEWTFVLPAIFANGLRSGLFIFLFKQFFSGLPKEIEEAAKIDGCGAFKTYWKIMLPMARPAIVTVLLFSAVWHWNDLYTSSMYFIEGTQPVMPTLDALLNIMAQEGLMESMSASQDYLRVYIASGALLAILPPLIIYLIFQRLFTESIAKTGIVG